MSFHAAAILKTLAAMRLFVNLKNMVFLLDDILQHVILQLSEALADGQTQIGRKGPKMKMPKTHILQIAILVWLVGFIAGIAAWVFILRYVF